MKNNNFKFWTVAYFLFFVVFTGSIFAQNAINLSGTFEGLRSQYNRNHTAFSQEFQYKYDLVQKDNIVQGVSTIISQEGDYAEVGIRGVVINDKFYFEEFKMLDQIKPNSMQWCYKSGVLNISTKDNEIILSGNTASYMVNYGIACTGGFTKLSGFVENQDTKTFKTDVENSSFEFNLYPNPTTDLINFSFFNEKQQNVTVEIFDLSGRSLIGSKTRKIDKGNFTERINIQKLNFSAGLYVFKMTVGEKVYTKEFVVVHK